MHSRSAARRRHGVEFKAKALNWRATSLASSAFSFNALIQLSGTVPMPKRPEVVQLIDTLLETMTESQVATRLSELNHRNWLGEPFTLKKVMHVRIVYGLKSLSQRLRERGMLTADEVARQLDISTTTVHQFVRTGLLKRHLYGNRRCLYEPPGDVKGSSSGQGLRSTHSCQRSRREQRARTIGKHPENERGVGRP